MTMSAIKNKELYRVEGHEGQVWYGCDQMWYRTKWQRMGGCGPSTASNLIYYLGASRSDSLKPARKHSLLTLMETIWNYVTPTFRGVSNTGIMAKGIARYAKEHGINIIPAALDVPKRKSLRPGAKEVIAFLEESLGRDMPVAFLNLHNGGEPLLDSWHWVTVVALETEGDLACATILDSGTVKTIDLAAWLSCSVRGGGFVTLQYKE